MARDWDSLLRSPGGPKFKRPPGPADLPPTPGATYEGAANVRDWDELANMASTLPVGDPGIVQSGIDAPGPRARYSMADTPQEREASLTKDFGPGGFGYQQGDKAPYITQAGQRYIGQIPFDAKGVLLDGTEGFEPVGDIADMRGEALPIAGAVAGSLLTGGTTGALGLGARVLAAGAGSATGKAVQEGTEIVENQQSAKEVLEGINTSFFEGAAGEVFGAAAGKLVNFIRAPMKGQVPEGAMKMLEEAREVGVSPSVTAINGFPLLRRANSVITALFGPINAKKNADAILKEQARLSLATKGRALEPTKLGSNIADDIVVSKEILGEEASKRFGIIDDFAGGEPVFQTHGLTQRIDRILKSMPPGAKIPASVSRIPYTSKDGKVIFHRTVRTPEEATDPVGVDPSALASMKDFLRADNMMSARNLADLRTRLAQLADDKDLIGKVDNRHFWSARASIDNIFKEAEESTTSLVAIAERQGLTLNAAQKSVKNLNKQIKQANKWYAKERKKFDSKFINKLTTEPKYAGNVDPHRIADMMSRATPTEVKRVFDVVSPQTKSDVRRAFMDKAINASLDTSDPINHMFSANGFRTMLKSMEDTGSLRSVLGKSAASDLKRLERVMLLVGKKDPTAGLLVANIGLHPVNNFSLLGKLRVASWIFSQPAAIKWLTVGYTQPAKRVAAFNKVASMVATSGIEDVEDGPPQQVQ